MDKYVQEMPNKEAVAIIEDKNNEIIRLRQDNEDMRNSRQTSFWRCPKCRRLSDEGYQCYHCGAFRSVKHG